MGAPESLCRKGILSGEGRRWAQLGEVVTAGRHAGPGGHTGKAHRDLGCKSHLSLDVTPVGTDAGDT